MNPNRRSLLLLLAAIAVICSVYRIGNVYADNTSDYAALTSGVTQAGLGSGVTPGIATVHGRNSFPVLMESVSPYRAVMAAGYYSDDLNKSRAVIYAHTAWSNTAGSVGDLYSNAIRWAGKKDSPVVGTGSGIDATGLQARGFTVKSISGEMSTPDNDLSGVDVFAIHLHYSYTPEALDKIKAFAANGGGLVIVATPWALSGTMFSWTNNLLVEYGLGFNTDYQSNLAYIISSQPWSSYFSALNAGDALIKDYNGEITLSAQDKTICALTIEKVLGVYPNLTSLNQQIQTLSNSYGLINITNAAPLRKAEKPVEAMLTRYQSNQLSTMPASQLPVHPSASDWPGLPGEGANVTRTISVLANAPKDILMNQGTRGIRIATGLYARPGSVITVTIPEDKADKGLDVQVGIHEDVNFNLNTWRRHPKIFRRDSLKTAVTEAGSAWGGFIFIWVPQNANLGNVDVTINGAIEAPYFIHGVTTAEEWNTRIKHNPGSWGVMQSDKISLYVSRNHLIAIDDPNKIIGHWAKALDIGDGFMGYLDRKRGEAAITDRDIFAGGGHAGYPFIMAYGTSDALTNRTVNQGDWGFYHELGHTYQDNFDGNYTFATHGEVDVNLVPGLLWSKLHNKTSWDVPTLNFYGSNHRISRRNNFLALPADQQTWAEACNLGKSNHAAYDFYYNLSDAFGWDMYRQAHTRLFRFLQNPDNEPELKALDSTDPNYRRNRMFLLYSQAAGKNFAPYFERYGLGKGSYGITQSVKDKVAHLPIWTDNSPVSSLSNPGTLAVPANTQANTPIYTFTATDPEPGTVFTYEITAGNETGAFSIDARTGILSAAAIDMTRPEPYTLTVKVSDNGVPRYSLEQTFNIIIAPPSGAGAIINNVSTINGNIRGSIQIQTPNTIILNGNASVNGNLFVPGTPKVVLNGTPKLGGTIDGTGSPDPTNYTVMLNGNASLNTLVRKTNPIAWPAAITTDGVQNIIVNGNETKTLPAGIYGNVIINGGGKLIITGGALRLTGGLTLNGNSSFEGHIIAPSGTIIVNGNSVLTGSVIANGLNINGGGTLSLNY